MTTLNLINIGNSVGAIFPKELLAKLNADKGDTLNVTDIPYGIGLTIYDERHARVMEIAERVMKEDRDVLRKLAE